MPVLVAKYNSFGPKAQNNFKSDQRLGRRDWELDFLDLNGENIINNSVYLIFKIILFIILFIEFCLLNYNNGPKEIDF